MTTQAQLKKEIEAIEITERMLAEKKAELAVRLQKQMLTDGVILVRTTLKQRLIDLPEYNQLHSAASAVYNGSLDLQVHHGFDKFMRYCETQITQVVRSI